MAQLCDLGITGLATMGANLARNAARNGFKVALHNRTDEKTDGLVREHGHEGTFVATHGIPEFVAALERPRAILVMVKAGKPVDDVIAEIVPHLDPGDLLVDGGNSLYADTARRAMELAGKGFGFLGMGVSGGEVGALEGPSIMPGGDRRAYARVRPMFEKMSAHVKGTPCCAFLGDGGAGHYVKMVHNGIEYADMQLIAETYDVLRSVYALGAAEIAKVFRSWKTTDLDSYLIDITTEVLEKADPSGSGPLVDVILDEAEQKGTGRWTAVSGLELGVPITTITEAVFARTLSALKTERLAAEKLFNQTKVARETPSADAFAALRDALYASKIVAYAQGFEQLAAASKEFGWDLDLATIARIWRGGCIIRAGFLDRIMEAYGDAAPDTNLLTVPYFHDSVATCERHWRAAVTLAIDSGLPVPAFSSSLAYFDGYRRGNGPANLLQGLRDYFGSHTYHRTDRDGVYHILWSEGGAEVKTGD